MVDEEDIRENSKLFIDSIIESDGEKCYTFTLIVTNYSKIRPNVLYKSHYICDGKNHRQFYLKRSTRGYNNDGREHVEIEIGLIPGLQGGYHKYGIKGSEIPGNDASFKCGILLRNYCITETPETTPHAKLQISYIITVPTKKKSDDIRNAMEENSNLEIIPVKECRHYCSVSKQMEELLLSEKFSDLKIVVGEEIFNVHRAILGLRSPVFATMLETDMKEKKENKIVIEDCDSKTFKEFLHYIYFGKIRPLTVELAMKLFNVSKKYSFETLKLDSLDFLTYNINKSNVFDIYKLADLHEESELKSTAEDFIVSNLEDIMKMPEWNSFRSSNEFLNTLLSKMAKRTSENYQTYVDYRPFKKKK